MKNMMIGACIGLAGGMAVASYAMQNPKTKQATNRMINKAMDNASVALDDMKKNMRQK